MGKDNEQKVGDITESDLVLLDQRLIAHISWQQDYAVRFRLTGKILTLVESILPEGQQCEAAKQMAKQIVNRLCDDLCDEVNAIIASLAEYQGDEKFKEYLGPHIQPYDFTGTGKGWK